MHELHPLIVDLSLMTIYAAITTLIFKKLKQPTVLGYLLAGIFAGPHFNFLPTVSDFSNLALWADIGVIFLLFSLGLEFSYTKMISVGKSALLTATLNIFLLLFFGYYIGLFLGWTILNSFFLGAMISMSSTTIIIKAFEDLNIKKQRFTDLVFGVLIIEDIMGILLLVLLPTIALSKSLDGGVLWLSTTKLLFFLVLSFVAGIYIIPSILRKLSDFINDEMLLLIAVTLVLSMVCLAVYSGFSSALGAFLVGSVLSETVVIARIENIIKPLKDFFGAVFFISVGMMVQPQMFVVYSKPILIITLVVLVGKIILSVFGFVMSGQTLKTSVQGGFALAQVGEFAFIIAALGMNLKVLDDFVYPVIVAVSVITTFLTPLMIKFSPSAYKLLERRLPKNWLNNITQLSKPKPTELTEERLWRALFKSCFIRMAFFALILYTILIFCGQVIRPIINAHFEGINARLLLTLITLLLMSPFLKGLIGWNITLSDVAFKFFGMFKRKTNKSATEICHTTITKSPLTKPFLKHTLKNTQHHFKQFLISNKRIAKMYAILWYVRKANRIPLLVLTSFRLIVAMFFIVTTVRQFLSEDIKVTFLLLVVSLLLISGSQMLLNQYLKMEKQFLYNLNGNTISKTKENTGENI